jgi:hypothetical protein
VAKKLTNQQADFLESLELGPVTLISSSRYKPFLTTMLISAYRYKLVSVLYYSYKSYDCLYRLTDINKYKLSYTRTILLSLTNYHCIRIYNTPPLSLMILLFLFIVEFFTTLIHINCNSHFTKQTHGLNGKCFADNELG